MGEQTVAAFGSWSSTIAPEALVDGAEQRLYPLASHGRDQRRRPFRPARGADRLIEAAVAPHVESWYATGRRVHWL